MLQEYEQGNKIDNKNNNHNRDQLILDTKYEKYNGKQYVKYKNSGDPVGS